MRLKRTLFFLVALTVMFVLPMWFTMFHQEPSPGPTKQQVKSSENENENEVKAQVSPRVMDQILADDLSLTTSLFMTQLSSQLQRWADLDLSRPTIEKQFEKELSDHQHLHSFALMKDDKVRTSKGDFPEERLEFLKDRNSDKDIYFSKPYAKKKAQFMLMAKKMGDEWVIGEVNLSFVKKFVGDIGSVADASGSFFINADGSNVNWESKHKRDQNKTEQTVPELGWQIVIQSDQKKQDTRKTHYKDGQAVVQFKEPQQAEDWLAKHRQFKVIKKNHLFYILAHAQQSTSEMIELLRKEDAIQSAEPNYIYKKQQSGSAKLPNDEFFEPYQWNLSQIYAEKGWQITGGEEDVIIAILDTGVDLKHPDLSEKIVDGYNAYDDSSNAQDDHGHGTHVAGIAAAITNNVTGIAGVSWHNPIMPVKVLNEKGEGSLYEIASGVTWAVDHGAKVINMSLGDSEQSKMLHDAIQYAYEHDVVLIAASGNENVNTEMYPAAYDEVLAVSAVNQNSEKAAFSNYGEYVDVSAPGEHIPSTFPDDNYVFMSGTSMAAPHVTGLAGLIRSIRPELTNDEVMQLIRETAEDLGQKGHDAYYGYGQINVTAALDEITTSTDPMKSGEPGTHDLDWIRGWIEKVRKKWLDQ